MWLYCRSWINSIHLYLINSFIFNATLLNLVLSWLASFFKKLVLCLYLSQTSNASTHKIVAHKPKINSKKLIWWWMHTLKTKIKKFHLRINVMKTSYVGLSRTLTCITYKNITFKKKIQDKESHIFFQNKISSRSPINAASKSEVCVFLESKLLIGLHLKNFFIDVSIIFTIFL